MRYIKIANENGLVNNDPIISPLPTVPDPIPATDYVYISVPCVLVPVVGGSLLHLLDPRRWDHGASHDSVEHSIGTVLDLLDELGIDCGESSAMLEYIADLRQSGCELIAVNPDNTERIVWSAHYCEQGGIGTPPAGWEPPPPPGPLDGGWDDPGEVVLPGGLTDENWCGAAIRAMEFVVSETDALMINIEAATDIVEAIDAVIPLEATPVGWVADTIAGFIGDAIDAGTTQIQSYLASSDFQDAMQCAFFCAMKQHQGLNNEIIRDAMYQVVRHNPLYSLIAAFWEPILELGAPGASIEVYGAVLSRRKLIRESFLGLDEPSNDCAALCTDCAPVGWYARLDMRRPDVQALVTEVNPPSWIVEQTFDTLGIRSGYYKDGPDYFPMTRFRLSWGSGALLQRMAITYGAEAFYPVTYAASDYIFIVPEGGGSRYLSPVPRGPHIHTVDWDPAISPERADITIVLSKTDNQSELSHGMIRVTTIELWGTGSPPDLLTPYTEIYT